MKHLDSPTSPTAAAGIWIAVFAVVSLVSSSTVFAQSSTQLDSYLVEVDGMACAFCARGLERELNELEGAGEPDFDLEAGEIDLPVEQGHTISPATLEELIVDAGYAVRGLHLSGTATITNSGDEFVAVFSRDLGLPLPDYDSDEGTFDIEGTLSQHNERWTLELTSRETP